MDNNQELEPTPVPGTLSVAEAVAPPHRAARAPTKLPSLWRNRDYMLLWSGQVVSVIGTGASQIVYPLLILALTNSPTAAGLAAALGSLPYIFFSLPAGAFIDRWDRKRVMIYCDIGRALTLGSIPVALAFNALTIWQIYLAALIEGSLFVFFNIAEVAALSRVVAKGQFPAATAQNEAAFTIANIIAPSIGTTLYQTFGRAFPFVFDSISYAVSVISLFFIRTKFQTERLATQLHLRAEIAEGLRWLWHQRLVRFIAFTTGMLNFIGAGSTLILILLAKSLGAADAQIGLIFSLASIGGVIGSVIGGFIQKRFTFGQVIITTVAIQAVVFPLFAVVRNFWLIPIIAAFIFVTGPVYNVVQFSYRLALIPDALQGRVNSTFRLIAFGFQPLGAALSGILIEHIGLIPTILFYSIWGIALAITVALNSNVRHARPLGEVQPV
jgi:predicted MFS family arabinose efflux permease